MAWRSGGGWWRLVLGMVVLTASRGVAQDAERNDSTGAPVLVAGRDGFGLRSADGEFQLRLRGYFQTDSRVFLDDGDRPATSTLLTRRIRPILEGTLWGFFDFRFIPDFANGQAALYDAYADLRLRPALAVRVGKFKPPVGLERLQSATDLVFVERGLPTNLVPSRDLGVELRGETGDGVLAYAAGVFNGAADLGNQEGDNGDGKDLDARVFIQPFRNGGADALRGLGLGVAVTTGNQDGTAAAPGLPAYRSPAQAPVFAYRSDGSAGGTTIASGRRTRLSPQGYWYAGPIGVLAEYVRSSQEVRLGSSEVRLDHEAWQVAGTWVLTGESASFRGVEPGRPFDPRGGGWGAFAIGARYGALLLDPDAFPVFADPASQIAEARAWGVAADWYLARGLRLMVDYERTTYDGGTASGNRPAEQAVLVRLQTAF